MFFKVYVKPIYEMLSCCKVIRGLQNIFKLLTDDSTRYIIRVIGPFYQVGWIVSGINQDSDELWNIPDGRLHCARPLTHGTKFLSYLASLYKVSLRDPRSKGMLSFFEGPRASDAWLPQNRKVTVHLNTLVESDRVATTLSLSLPSSYIPNATKGIFPNELPSETTRLTWTCPPAEAPGPVQY